MKAGSPLGEDSNLSLACYSLQIEEPLLDVDGREEGELGGAEAARGM